MAYEVSIVGRAQRDLENLYREINADRHSAANKWYLGLKAAMSSLRDQPYRCPPIAARAKSRNLFYGRSPHIYRVIYRILERERQVEILHIRHGSRQTISSKELK